MDYQQPYSYGVIQPNQKRLLYQANAQVSVFATRCQDRYIAHIYFKFAEYQSPQRQNDQYIIVGELLEL